MRSPSAREHQHINDVLAKYAAEYRALPGVSADAAPAELGADGIHWAEWMFYEGFWGAFSPALLAEAIPLLALGVIVHHYGGAWAMVECEDGWDYAAWHPELPDLVTASDLRSGCWATEPDDEPSTPATVAWNSFQDIRRLYLDSASKRYSRRLERSRQRAEKQ